MLYMKFCNWEERERKEVAWHSSSSSSSSFVRMLQGLVEGLVDVSMSLTKLSSRLDFFFFIVYLPSMSLIQMTVFLD